MSDSRLHQSLALVVDGGGTKTDCHVLDRAGDHVTVLGFGTATGSNPGAVGIEAATVAIRLAVQRAKIAACLPPTTTCAELRWRLPVRWTTCSARIWKRASPGSRLPANAAFFPMCCLSSSLLRQRGPPPD